MLKPHDSLWFRNLSANGYRIVYFHLRGSGFSQLPKSNDYDEYIRTEYAADDIEEIREDLFGTRNPKKRWDAVVGYSYGSVLAQQYVSKYQDSANKLILIGPISLDKFVNCDDPMAAYNTYESEVMKIRAAIIDKIYDLKKFRDELKIREDQKTAIKEMLFGAVADHPNRTESKTRPGLGIFHKIETNFGTEQSVIDNYDKIKAHPSKQSKGRNLFEELGLNYGRSLFKALRELHLYGWRTDNDGAVNQSKTCGDRRGDS